MGKDGIPTTREAVILGLLINGEKYGREIRQAYERETKRSLSYGALYVTLDRMEQQGYVKSRLGESCHEHGGYRRKYFRITADGHRAIDSLQTVMSILAGRTSNAQ